jgi:hypothetical protein
MRNAFGIGRGMSYGRVLLATAMTCSVASNAWGESAIFWISSPVRAGQTVLLTGYFPRPETISVKVRELARVEEKWEAAVSSLGVATTVVKASESSVAFVLPAGDEGVYTFRLDEAGETPLYGRVNLPDVWWTLGESPIAAQAIAAEVESDAASPGATIRIFGRALTNGLQPAEVELRSSVGHGVPMKVIAQTPYALTVAVPDTIPTGNYSLTLRAIAGNTGSESVPRAIEIHPKKTVSLKTLYLKDFGAIGDGAFDNAPVFDAALAKAGTLGGAEVRIAEGAFRISRPLDIPPGVYLAGESPDLTELAFPDVASPPEVWIQGERYFGLRDLAVYCGNHRTIISSDMSGDPDKSGHIRIRNVRVIGDSFRGQPKIDEIRRRLAPMVQTAAQSFETVRLSGPDISVEDSYLLGSGRSLYLYRASGAVVRKNKLFNGMYGWYNFDVSENIVTEDNLFQGASLLANGGSYSAGRDPKRSQNIYTANNTYTNMLGGNREAITTDGGGGAYSGYIAKAEDKRLVLMDHPNWANKDWHGAVVVIIAGHGLGQWRTLTSWTESEIEVSSTFDIVPDARSTITIVPAQTHYIFFRNHFQDTGLSIQLYGTAIEHIVAENDSTRAGGFYLLAETYGTGVQPALNVQFLQNEIRPGLNYHYGENSVYFAGPSFIEARVLTNSLILGLVLRNNILAGQAAIHIVKQASARLSGILLEKNDVSGPGRIQVDESASAEVTIR